MIINKTLVGGIDINGVIAEYAVQSGSSISAGDFVEFINEKTFISASDNTINNIANTYPGMVSQAVLLPNDYVFIAHYYNGYLYGIAVHIYKGTVTKGADTLIDNTTAYSGKRFEAALLPNGNIFIAHSAGGSLSTLTLSAIVCSVSGTTITVGTNTAISAQVYSGYRINCVPLIDNKILIIYSYSSSEHLYGIVCTISGMSIACGTETALITTSMSGEYISSCLLTTSSVFIAHSTSAFIYLSAMIVTISGTTITTNSDTALNSTDNNSGSRIRTVAVSNDSVVVVHSFSNNYYLGCIATTILGTTITAGSDLILNNTCASSGNEIGATLTPDGNVLVCYMNTYSSTNYLYFRYLSVSNRVITAYTENTLANTLAASYHAPCPLFLKSKKALILHAEGDAYILYGLLASFVHAVPYSSSINGVAITGGANGANIDVIIPA